MTDSPVRPRRGLPHLRAWYAKMLFIVVAVSLYYLSGYLAPTDNSRGILRSVLVLLFVLLAARVFRADNEPDDEPRPWWRMTGRPTAGFVLGILCALIAIGLVIYGFGIESQPGFTKFASQEPYVVVTAIVFAVLAVLYIPSSLRLRGLAREARLEAERKADSK